MTHNIKEIRMKDNLIVEAVFFCGVVKDFGVSLVFEKHTEYKVLKEDNNLWQNAELLPQGSGVYINDEMDLTAEEIWKYGKIVGKVPVEPKYEIACAISSARVEKGLSQKQLSLLSVSLNVTFQELKALLQILRWKHCAEYAKCWSLS